MHPLLSIYYYSQKRGASLHGAGERAGLPQDSRGARGCARARALARGAAIGLLPRCVPDYIWAYIGATNLRALRAPVRERTRVHALPLPPLESCGSARTRPAPGSNFPPS